MIGHCREVSPWEKRSFAEMDAYFPGDTHFTAEFGLVDPRQRKNHKTRIDKIGRMQTKKKADTAPS
jgi:hypothetical protein